MAEQLEEGTFFIEDVVEDEVADGIETTTEVDDTKLVAEEVTDEETSFAVEETVTVEISKSSLEELKKSGIKVIE